MRHLPTLVRRELGAYFLSPMAWLILLGFQAIAWLNFWDLIETLAAPQRGLSKLSDPMVTYISGSMPFWIAIMIAIPALTMRLLAEEKRSGTIETLLTVPVNETEVVISKWLAGTVMFLVLLIPYVIYLPFLYHQAEYHFDLGPIASLAIGLASMGMMFVAIGIFFSAMSRNQIVAAIGTFVVLFLMLMLTFLGYRYAASRGEVWAEALKFCSVLYQAYGFGVGQLDLRVIGLHMSVVVFMLYMAVKVLQSREDRG